MTSQLQLDWSDQPTHEGRVVRDPLSRGIISAFGESPALEAMTQLGIDPHRPTTPGALRVVRHLVSMQP